MSASHEQGDTHLLEIMRTRTGVRVSLCPIRATAMATLSGYEELEVDHRELSRLSYELRVQLGRANMRGQLDQASAEEVRKLGHLLFDELLPTSVKNWLREREGGDLLIRTDEDLVDVPWELLHTGRAHLAMQMNLGRLISASGAAPQVNPRRCRAPYTALVLADPCGDLDAAYDEGIRLRDLLDGQPYLRVALQSSEVPRAFVRENVRECDILHFAGHAEIGGRGDGWLLSDGRFTPEDVERLTGGRPFPSLVFANACGSGRSSRAMEGAASTWSLARTFLAAGVRHFIGTHWDVPDVIAGDFAEHFYRGLCAGLSVGTAMRRARIAVNVAHGEGAILWGSYCLYGDPNHIYFPEALGIEEPEPSIDLVVVEPDPETVRGVYHTLDVPVSELLETGSQRPEGLGLNPSLRNEAVMAQPSQVGVGVRDLTSALMITAAVATCMLLAAIGHQAWEHFGGSEAPSMAMAAAEGLSHDEDSAKGEEKEPTAPVMPPAVEQIREQEAAAEKAPPRVRFDVHAQTRTSRDDVVEVSVIEGTRLRSGDNMRVTVHPDRDVYAALIMLDGKNSPQLLFPHPSVRTANGDHIPAGAEVELPGDGLWYRLDKRPGVETLILLASRQPLTDLDGFMEALGETGARKQGKARGGVVIRGVGGVTSKKRAGRNRKDPGAVRTRQLASIQSLAHRFDIEVIQAVTYVHLR